MSSRPIRQRLAFAASALGVLSAMLVPSVASAAGGVGVTHWGQLTYVDMSSTANRVTITSLGSGQYRVVDQAGISSNSDCNQVSSKEVTCSDVTSIYVSTHNGDDEVAVNLAAATSPVVTVLGGGGADKIQTGPGADKVFGGDGADSITPGAGLDKVDAGTGNDVIAAREGAADTIKCGADSDGGTADTADVLEPDCETVAKPTGTATGQVAGTPPVPENTKDPDPEPTYPEDEPADTPGATTPPIGKVDPLANPLPVIIPTQAPTLDAKATSAAVQVACPAGTGRCKGTVTLEVAESDLGKASVAAAAAKLVKIGEARFVAKAGAKPIVKVRLSRRGRRRVIRGRKRQRCRITVATTSPVGKTLVTRRTVTLVTERRTSRRISKRRTAKRGSRK